MTTPGEDTKELSTAFERVTSGFYRRPHADDAAMALRYWCLMLAGAKEAELGRLMVLFYLFARIGQVSDAARAAFGPIVREYSGAHAELARRLDTDPRIPNALDLPIEGPASLDLLWAEFFVTGGPEPIVRIISVLDNPDGVRRRLATWVGERSLFGGSKRRATADTLSSVGLVVDLEHKIIKADGDLDCLCFAIAEKSFPIFQHLPFELTPQELQVLSVKGAALWSLRLNAQTHTQLPAICRDESRRAGGAGRLRLVETAEAARPFAL
jgi:hypothetical protein